MPRLDSKSLNGLIEKHLENPTHEMHVAFCKLPAPHKWLLFTFLEVGAGGFHSSRNAAKDQFSYLKDRFEALCPEPDLKAFAMVLLELTEGFLRREKAILGTDELDWIHPSCRDLTIEELAANLKWRRHFLQRCSVAGLQIATSVGGGAKGERLLPLLKSVKDWEAFSNRCTELECQNQRVAEQLLFNYKALSTRVSSTDRDKEALSLFKTALQQMWTHYDKINREQSEWDTRALRTFLELRQTFTPGSHFPGLASCWSETVDSLCKLLEDHEESITEAAGSIEEFVSVASLIDLYETSFFAVSVNLAVFERAILALCQRGKAEENSHYFRSDFDNKMLKGEGEVYSEL